MSQQDEPSRQDKTKKQRHAIKLTIVLCVTFITLVMIGFLNKITTPRYLSVNELRANGAYMFDKPRELSDFTLLDHLGNTQNQSLFEGHWTLVFFGFTHCPDVCPNTMALLQDSLSKMDENLLEQLQVVMITLDPERDTPEALKNYLQFFNPDFIGLTGEFPTLRSLAGELNTAYAKVMLPDSAMGYTIDHGTHISLINPKGDFHGMIKPPLDAARVRLVIASLITWFDEMYAD